MARACTVCAHADRSAIDRELVSGREPLRAMGIRWNVSKDALARHRSHVAASITQAQERELVERGDDLVQQLRDLKDEARALGAAAKTAGDIRTALSAIDKLTRLVELQARMVGELRDRELTVNVGVAIEHSTPEERRRDMRLALDEIRREAPDLLVDAVAGLLPPSAVNGRAVES